MTERDWELNAACRTEDPEVWFSGKTRTKARDICGACPVQEACLEATLRREDGLPRDVRKGLFAGRTGAERYAIEQKRKRETKPKAKPKAKPQKSNRRWNVAPCGTRAAYQRHVRKGEPIDAECRAANTQGKREHQRTGSTQVPASR